jgi:DNA polymerase
MTMSQPDRPIDPIQQLKDHLQSLRAAGLLFLPKGEPIVLSLAASPSGGTTGNGHGAPAVPAAAPAGPAVAAANPAPSADSAEGRRQALTVLAAEVEKCDLCPELYATRTQTVFGVGPVDPEVAFVGEAPGADEDRQGEPFVGRAGQLLTKIITACGFQRSEVYIFNTLKCRPPNNRTPLAHECDNCRPYFEKQFELVRPKYLVTLGATAAKHLLETSTGITKLRGKLYEYRGVPLICTYHPSALLRDETERYKRDCWEDMKLLLRTMGRPIPEVKRG